MKRNITKRKRNWNKRKTKCKKWKKNCNKSKRNCNKSKRNWKETATKARETATKAKKKKKKKKKKKLQQKQEKLQQKYTLQAVSCPARCLVIRSPWMRNIQSNFIGSNIFRTMDICFRESDVFSIVYKINIFIKYLFFKISEKFPKDSKSSLNEPSVFESLKFYCLFFFFFFFFFVLFFKWSCLNQLLIYRSIGRCKY